MQEIDEIKRELNLIHGSNTFKIWIKPGDSFDVLHEKVPKDCRFVHAGKLLKDEIDLYTLIDQNNNIYAVSSTSFNNSNNGNGNSNSAIKNIDLENVGFLNIPQFTTSPITKQIVSIK